MNYIYASPSSAHTYGNMTAFAVEYIKGLFPKNYFNTVQVSSKIAFKEFNIFQNKNKEFFKKNKPILVIRPRIELNNRDTFLNGTYLTTRIADNFSDVDFGNLQDFIQDKDKGINIKYLMNRVNMYFDITVIVETHMAQLDLMSYLKNRIMIERPFNVRTCLENQVPREFINILSQESGVPIYDENNSISNFIEYINSNSIYPVTYKMKNSTGNDEFFRYYPVNCDTMFTEFSLDDGNKKGMIYSSFSLTSTMSMEFYTAGLFYYFTQKPELLTDVNIGIETDNKIIPIFTMNNIFESELPNGWSLYASPLFKVDSMKIPEVLDLTMLTNESLNNVVKYHKDKGMDISTFLTIRVSKDNDILVKDRDYTVDYDTMKVVVRRLNMDSTYRLYMYVNPLYINNLISHMYDFDKEK